MKLYYLLSIILVLIYNRINAQKDNFLAGRVIKYAKIENDLNYMVDTLTGQFRSLEINVVSKKIYIKWEFNNEKIPIVYNITKISNTINYNQTTHKNESYLNYHLEDSDGFPLLIMISKDLKYFYISYFYSNKENGFKKTEKIEILEHKIISL